MSLQHRVILKGIYIATLFALTCFFLWDIVRGPHEHNETRTVRAWWRRNVAPSKCEGLGQQDFMLGAACFEGYSDSDGIEVSQRNAEYVRRQERELFSNCLTTCRDWCKAPAICTCSGDGGFSCRAPGEPPPCFGQHRIGARCENGGWVLQ